MLKSLKTLQRRANVNHHFQHKKNFKILTWGQNDNKSDLKKVIKVISLYMENFDLIPITPYSASPQRITRSDS